MVVTVLSQGQLCLQFSCLSRLLSRFITMIGNGVGLKQQFIPFWLSSTKFNSFVQSMLSAFSVGGQFLFKFCLNLFEVVFVVFCFVCFVLISFLIFLLDANIMCLFNREEVISGISKGTLVCKEQLEFPIFLIAFSKLHFFCMQLSFHYMLKY